MNVDFFMPEYMKDFKCVASKCVDTCCAGWEINVDKETFLKYKGSNGILGTIVEGKFSESIDQSNDLTYGYMNIKDNKCPFLDENLLCEIHGKTTEENLSITCRRYPRIYNIIDGVYEKSGTSSCVEICRKAFLSKEKMEFVEWKEDIDVEKIRIGRILDTDAFFDTGSILEYFWNIRIFTINVMQERKFTIPERLKILKDIFSYILKENNSEEFFLDEYLENVDLNLILNKSNISFECNTIKKLIFSADVVENIRGIRFKRLLNSKNKTILKENDAKTALKKHEYILENYLVNHIFKEVIPFNKGIALEKSIDELIAVYFIIEGYLLQFILKETITDEEVINIIQAINKDLEHNKDFRKSLNLI